MDLPESVSIVLAAGSSARLDKHKALLETGNKSAVRRVVECSLASAAGRIIIVLGANAGKIKAELHNLPVEIVQNNNFESGRTGSLKCALRHLKTDLDKKAVLLFPVDCPFVPFSVLDQLLACYLQERKNEKESFWIVPEYNGRRGHPALIAGPVVPSILLLADDYSLRKFLHDAVQIEQSVRCLTVPAESESVLDNINTREDILRIWAREGLVDQNR